jgi:hypothetical protein
MKLAFFVTLLALAAAQYPKVSVNLYSETY